MDPMKAPVSMSTIFRWAVAATLGVSTVLVSILAVWTVRDMLVLALVALFVAVSLDPATRWLVRHRVRRPYAVTVIMLGATLVFATVIALVGPPLIREAGEISADIPRYVSDLEQRSETWRELSQRYGLDQHITRIAADLPQRIGNSVLSFFGRFLGVLVSALLVFVLSIYFMAALPRIRRFVPRLFPQRLHERATQVVDVVVDKVGNYMIGGLLISTIAGVTAYVAMVILQVPFALPLALLVFLTTFIPLIGVTIGSTICVIIAAIANGLWPSAVLLLVFFVVYQQLENYVIAPRVMQGRMNLPAVGVLLAGLLGGTMLGLVGALMAIPIAAAVKAVISEVRKPADEPSPDQPAIEAPPPPPNAAAPAR